MNGEAVVVRPIQRADAPALVGLHAIVLPDTLDLHVLLDHPTLSLAAAARFSEGLRRSDGFRRGRGGRAGRAGELRPPRHVTPAGMASFILTDTYQHHGVATLLFESLAEYARARGILRFIAELRAQNVEMLDLFAATGLRCTRHNGAATVRVDIDLRPTAAYRASCDRREATAEVASIAAILQPRSIAVVGAGRHRATSATRSSDPCLSATSRELSTRSILRRAPSAACPHFRRCCRFPSRSTWQSSPFLHQLFLA